MSRSTWVLGGALLAALGVDGIHAQQGPAGSIYTCVDGRGRRITADRPIPECLDREQRELSSTGTTKRQIGPSLSENERAAAEAQQRKEAEERNRVVEDRRRERVLLARYPDKAAHDVERAASMQQIDEVVLVAEKQIADLQRQRKALDAEMEFYKKDPNKAPMTLRRKIGELDEGVEEQKRVIAAQDGERKRIHQRFDAELVVLKRLWEAQRAANAGAAGGGAPSPASR